MSSGTLCEVHGLEKTPGAERPSGSPGMSASLFCTLPQHQNGLFYTSQALWLRDVDLIPGSGKSPGGGHGSLFQYSCLGKPMDRVHGVAKEPDMTT